MFKRRIVCATILIGLLLGLTACGDSKKGIAVLSAESVYQNTISEDNSAYIFNKDETFPPILGISGFCMGGKTVYYYSEFIDTMYYFGYVNLDMNDIFKLADFKLDEGESISMMVSSVDERIGFVVTDGAHYRLIEYDGKNMWDKGDITSIFNLKKGIVLEMYHVKNGYVVVRDDKIVGYDESFEKTSEVNSRIGCSCLDKNGNVVVAYNDRGESFSAEGSTTNVISVFDVESGEITDKYEAKLGELTDVTTGTGDNDIYIYAGDVYGLNYTNKTEKKIMSLYESGFDEFNFGFEFLDERTVFVSYYNTGSDEPYIGASLEKYVLN